MPQYIMLMRDHSSGLKAICEDPAKAAVIRGVLERWEAKVLGSWRLLGEWDQCTIFDAADNFTAYYATLAQELGRGAQHTDLLSHRSGDELVQRHALFARELRGSGLACRLLPHLRHLFLDTRPRSNPVRSAIVSTRRKSPITDRAGSSPRQKKPDNGTN